MRQMRSSENSITAMANCGCRSSQMIRQHQLLRPTRTHSNCPTGFATSGKPLFNREFSPNRSPQPSPTPAPTPAPSHLLHQRNKPYAVADRLRSGSWHFKNHGSGRKNHAELLIAIRTHPSSSRGARPSSRSLGCFAAPLHAAAPWCSRSDIPRSSPKDLKHPQTRNPYDANNALGCRPRQVGDPSVRIESHMHSSIALGVTPT